jgi:SAM-dependent methyltransferase
MSEHYLEGRTALLDMAVDHLAATRAGRRALVVELGSGPGTMLARLADALPESELVGIEIDPVLRRLHELGPAVDHGDRISLTDVDLDDASWTRVVPRPGEVDVVVAVQVLHYFSPTRLVELLAEIGAVLAPDGVLVHVDHVPPDTPSGPERPTDPSQVGEHTVDPWGAWWTEARNVEQLAAAMRERDRWIVERPVASAEHHPEQHHLRGLFARAGLTRLEVDERRGDSLLTVIGPGVRADATARA